MAEEDNTKIDKVIQNLVEKLDEHIANVDQRRQILENAIESEIKALKKDQDEARELRLTLLHESGDTSSNLEAGNQKIVKVKQWLKQKALISGDTNGDKDQSDNLSMLIVAEDRATRDINRKSITYAGTHKKLKMEFQDASNGKEAVYLHLAGASFDLILMEYQMPIMTGIQATLELRKMGVKSRIVGLTSDSDQQAFIDAGLDSCIQKPLDAAKINTFLLNSNKRKRTDT